MKFLNLWCLFTYILNIHKYLRRHVAFNQNTLFLRRSFIVIVWYFNKRLMKRQGVLVFLLYPIHRINLVQRKYELFQTLTFRLLKKDIVLQVFMSFDKTMTSPIRIRDLTQ